MAVTAREQSVLDLHEAGVGRRLIAQQLDLSSKYVDSVLSRLSITDGSYPLHVSQMKRDSAKLRDAILNARGMAWNR